METQPKKVCKRGNLLAPLMKKSKGWTTSDLSRSRCSKRISLEPQAFYLQWSQPSRRGGPRPNSSSESPTSTLIGRSVSCAQPSMAVGEWGQPFRTK